MENYPMSQLLTLACAVPMHSAPLAREATKTCTSKTFSNASNCRRAAKQHAAENGKTFPDDYDVKPVPGGYTFTVLVGAAAASIDTTETASGIPAFLDRNNGKTKEEVANERAALVARASKEPVMRTSKIVNPKSSLAASTAKVPTTERRKLEDANRRQSAAPSKPTKSGIARASKAADKASGPSGMVAAILKLAERVNGVSADELNKMTKWKGAPWKWLFSNPKGTGYCDRWDYKFEVLEADPPKTSESKRKITLYKVTKKAK